MNLQNNDTLAFTLSVRHEACFCRSCSRCHRVIEKADSFAIRLIVMSMSPGERQLTSVGNVVNS